MKRQVIQTSDGSSTIYIPEMDETYHSTHGAIQEAEHVFIQNGLREMEKKGLEEIAIFEMGFGTGLNALLTKIRTGTKIEYWGIEAYPVNREELESLNYVDLLGEEYREDFEQIQNASWNERVPLNEEFTIKKIEEKIETFLMKPEYFDLVYFDAFGARAQINMWDIQILSKMYDGLKKGGSLVTYSARGQFKRDLKLLGFKVESLPGPPGKREMTLAWK